MGGGGETGLDWCMIKAGVRYTRKPDPAHVLSARGWARGWARGEERKTDNHRKRSPIKNVHSRHIIFLRANTVGPSARKLNKRFVHSFIHSFILIHDEEYLLINDRECLLFYQWRGVPLYQWQRVPTYQGRVVPPYQWRGECLLIIVSSVI